MPAIPYAKTDTVDSAWDGPAMEKALGQDEDDLRAAHAWVDPDGDSETKAAYRYIHHMVDSSGDPGAANLTACSTGIGVLNGGMTGTTIPGADVQGVYDHLAHHLKDAGKTPPELKSARLPGARRGSAIVTLDRVERMNRGGVELRATAEGGPSIYGHGATFNSLTVIDDWFGSYAEKVAPGAFTKTLADGADVRCLFNHDANYVIGRTKSGTLTLSEDSTGLAYEAIPPPTQWANDLQVSMKRGDITGSSFGFRIVREKWTTVLDPTGDGKTDMIDCRTVQEAQLFDVSPVTYPAYAASDSAARAILHDAFDLDAVMRATLRFQRGLTLRSVDVSAVRGAIEHLQRYLSAEPAATISAPGQPTHAPVETPATEPILSDHSESSDVLAMFARLERSIERDDRTQINRL